MIGVILAGTLLVGLLAACGSAAPTPTPTQAVAEEAAPVPAPIAAPVVEAPAPASEIAAAPPTTVTAEKPVPGGIWDNYQVPAVLDPYHLSGTGINNQNYYNSLIQIKFPYDPAKGVVYEPTLATEWSQSADGSKWTVKLRQGVTWHDGEAFNADDVVATLGRVLEPKYLVAGRQVPMRNIFTGIKKIDAYTVEFDTGDANATTFSYLASFYFNMMPEHLIKGDLTSTDPEKRWKRMGLKPNESGTLGVGTGPFKMTKWQADSHLNGERNPNYFKFDDQGNRLPYMDGIRSTAIPDAIRRLATFVAGGLEYSLGPGAGLTARDSKALCQQTRDPGCYTGLFPHGFTSMINNEGATPVFKDAKVNAASRYGHDLYGVMNTSYAGGTAYTWMDPSRYPNTALSLKEQYELLPWSDPARRQEYFNKAKGLMAEAGYANGVDLPLPFYGVGVGGGGLCTGSFLDQFSRHVDQLNQIGLRTNLECRAAVDIIGEIKAARFSVAGPNLAIYLLDPALGIIANALLDSNVLGAPWRWQGQEALDAKFRVIQKTTDPAKRDEGYKDIERYMADTSLTHWPGMYTRVFFAAHGCVKNYSPGGVWASQEWSLERVWLAAGDCRK